MLLTSRKFLVIFLVLLQFIAPLVHAHTHEQISGNLGLHVPGLENYSLASVPHDQAPQAQMSRASGGSYTVDGVLIAVNSGIRDQNTLLSHKILDSPEHDLFVLFRALNFSPQPAIALSYPARRISPPSNLFLITTCAPRAPPAQLTS